jgi:acyl-CoA thioester hydrolase
MHETKCRVRYAETDQMGVVYYANYYVWMEIGRVELVRALGIDYHEIERTDGLLLSVVESQCRYLAPARYDQEIIIATEIASSNTRLVEFRYEISAATTRQLLARGTTKHMWLNREFKPVRLPDKYLRMIRETSKT